MNGGDVAFRRQRGCILHHKRRHYDKTINRPDGRRKCTPIPLRGLSPEGKVLAVLCLVMLMRYIRYRRYTPLVAGATTFPPVQGALWVLSIVSHDIKGKRRAVYSPPPLNRAGVRRSGIGGGRWRRLLPAGLYLAPFVSNDPRTEILHCVQNDDGAGRQFRNAV